MNIIEFLIKAKISTYADGIKYKVASTRPNSIDYHYEEDSFIYHDTYFGSKEFYGEEIIYFDNSPYMSILHLFIIFKINGCSRSSSYI